MPVLPRRPFTLQIAVVLLLPWFIVTTAAADNPPVPAAQTRAHLHGLLDRPQVALAPRVQATTEGAFVVERGEFRSDARTVVPFLVYKPAAVKGRLPAVVVLHGTGGRKDDMAGVLRDLAGRGFVAIAIDARYHGERVSGGAHGSTEYQEAITRAWRETNPARQEHPFYYDTVYDLWRTADYLQSRRDVDPARLGILGFSMGGIQTWLAAGSDERYKVVVPAISVQSFRWSLTHGQWQGRANSINIAHANAAKDLGQPAVNALTCRRLWGKVIPGILDEFDCPQMLRAIAPRPLLLVGGDRDPNCPYGGAKIAIASAENAYRQAGAADHLSVDIAPGVGHEVTPAQREKIYAWLVRWLKP